MKSFDVRVHLRVERVNVCLEKHCQIELDFHATDENDACDKVAKFLQNAYPVVEDSRE